MIKIKGSQVVDDKGRRYNPVDSVSQDNLSVYADLRNRAVASGQIEQEHVVVNKEDGVYIVFDTKSGRMSLELELYPEVMEYEASLDLLGGEPNRQKHLDYLASALGLESEKSREEII